MVPDAIDLQSLSRVLVVKLRHHGDVLLTSPLFNVLKARAPHLEIDALVYADTEEMLSEHPAIHTLHTIGRRWKTEGWIAYLRHEARLLQALRARRYDLLVHLTEHPRGSWLARALGTRYAVTRDWSPRRGRLWHAAFTHRYRIPEKPRHTVEVHLDALRRIGIQPSEEERRLVLVPGREAESNVDEILRTQQALAGEPFVLMHPTSRWMFKSWRPDAFRELIERLQADGHRIVLTASPDERERAFVREITIGLRTPVVDLSGQLTLKTLAAIIGRARLFVGMDSVPMHIAAAMQTPVVALFGPSGEHEWGPWRVPHRVVTSPDFPCRPCGLDGCGQGKVSECLTTIRAATVYEACRALLAAS